MNLIRLLALLLLAAPSLLAAGWETDWDKAKAQAKELNRPILINFTGSDWCGWCIKLEQEVFSKPAFKDYAKDHLILMEVDFPRRSQPRSLKEQNEKLDKEFGISGYPTVYLVDAEGRKISPDIGYREGGPEAYVAHLKSLLDK